MCEAGPSPACGPGHPNSKIAVSNKKDEKETKSVLSVAGGEGV